MDTADEAMLERTRTAFIQVLRSTLAPIDDGEAVTRLREMAAQLAHLFETAPSAGEPVEQVKTRAILRASLDAAVRHVQMEIEQG